MVEIIGAALLSWREQQKYVIQRNIDAARRACFSRTFSGKRFIFVVTCNETFSTHIKMLSITSNIYLVPGIPGRSNRLLLKRTYDAPRGTYTCVS